MFLTPKLLPSPDAPPINNDRWNVKGYRRRIRGGRDHNRAWQPRMQLTGTLRKPHSEGPLLTLDTYSGYRRRNTK